VATIAAAEGGVKNIFVTCQRSGVRSGRLRRGLDRILFWTTADLEAKRFDFQHYYNDHRSMRGGKGACRNRLRKELYNQLASVRTGGGGTAKACAINSDSRLILLIRHAQVPEDYTIERKQHRHDQCESGSIRHQPRSAPDLLAHSFVIRPEGLGSSGFTLLTSSLHVANRLSPWASRSPDDQTLFVLEAGLARSI
jgi:hypothetical protein